MEALLCAYGSDEEDTVGSPPSLGKRERRDESGERATRPKQRSATEGLTPQHHGRIRSFEHVEGHYPTHVFLRVRTEATCRAALDALMVKVRLAPQRKWSMPVTAWLLVRCGYIDGHALLVVAGGQIASCVPGLERTQSSAEVSRRARDTLQWARNEYHLSLSRTVPVKEHQIQVLLKDLRRELRHQHTVSAECKRMEVFVNDDRTRTFLALALQDPSQVIALIRQVDAAFSLNRLPQFYQDPRPHVSVAWVLGDMQCELERVIRQVCPRNGSEILGVGGEVFRLRVEVDQVDCKVGKKLYQLAELKRR